MKKRHLRITISLILKQYKRYKRKRARLLEADSTSGTKLDLLNKRITSLKSILLNAFNRAKLASAAGALALTLSAGTSQAQNFLTPVLNPFGLSDVGNIMSPAFADLDGDGDQDMMSGEFSSAGFYYFQNTGTASSPVFTSPVANPFGIIDLGTNTFVYPTFTDLDDDGDFDMMVGSRENYGDLYYYQNTGNALVPNFAAPVINAFGFAAPGVTFDHSSPDFADLDNDGDQDMLVGAYGTTLFYYENIGTAVSPSFGTGVDLAVGTAFYDRVSLFDLDGDGDFDILYTDYYGTFFYIPNNGTVSSPVWGTQQTFPFGLVDVGSYVDSDLVDLDADGDLDLLSGVYNAGFYYFQNCPTAAAPTNITPTVNLSICTGNSTTLNVSGVGTFNWYDTSTGGTLLGTGASYITGVFTTDTTIYVQAVNGCGAGPFTPININVAPYLPSPTNTTPAANLTICSGQSTTLTVTGSGTLDWYDAATGGTFLLTGASYTTGVLTSNTTYYVENVDSCGAGPRTAITVTVNPLPNVATTSASVTITATLAGATSYQWINCPSFTNASGTSTNQSYTATANGDYAVIINDGGCADTSACVSVTTVGISNSSNLTSNILVYPNPSNGLFNIKSVSSITNLTITDVSGKIILTQNQQLAFIDLSKVERGVYMLTATFTNNSKTVVRIIKE